MSKEQAQKESTDKIKELAKQLVKADDPREALKVVHQIHETVTEMKKEAESE